MIYTLILKPKFRNTLRALAFVILVAFSAAIYSCQTVYTENYPPEKLKTDEYEKITDVTTKNDSTINLTGYDVTYFDKYKDSSNILLLEKTDTTFIKTEPHKEYKTTKKLSEIKLKDISFVKVEKTRTNWTKTIIWSGVALAALVIIGILVWEAAWSSGFSFGNVSFYGNNPGH